MSDSQPSKPADDFIPVASGSLLDPLPSQLGEEVFEILAQSDAVKIERIVSRGHSSPAEGWYDQSQNEWVMVVSGAGVVEYDNGEEFYLAAGEFLHIPAHQKHKVSWTDAKQPTVWLAVFY
ncbi:cupin domain-containing protein [Persicirhabdus sediminis]|uniref:Cupin domain-containing protein n=1 Tax=Persicirhabdus sediminis TaxID=454144 RepID=A0A8J7ME84_9BACT|nr:cupin domain-containing protein [Persicirhabdus sediminis]MBK1791123.1 cupin domain-containing protein [Persicirhabdus sediminis]